MKKTMFILFTISLLLFSCGYDTDPVSNSKVYPKKYPYEKDKSSPQEKRERIRQAVHNNNGKIFVADQAPKNILFERSVTVPAKKHSWVLPHNDAKYKNSANTIL